MKKGSGKDDTRHVMTAQKWKRGEKKGEQAKMKLQKKLILLMGSTALIVGTLVLTIAFLHLNATLKQIGTSRQEYAERMFLEKTIVSTDTAAKLLDRTLELKFNHLAAYRPLGREDLEECRNYLKERMPSLYDSEVIAAQYTLDQEKHPHFHPDLRFSFQKQGNLIQASEFPEFSGDENLVRFLSMDPGRGKTTYLISGGTLWFVYAMRNPDTEGTFTFYAFRQTEAILTKNLVPDRFSLYLLLSGDRILFRFSENPDHLRDFDSSASDRQNAILFAKTLSQDKVSTYLSEGNDPEDVCLFSGTLLSVPFFGGPELSLLKIAPLAQSIPPVSNFVDIKIEQLFFSILLIAFLGLLLFFVPLFYFARLIAGPISRAAAFANILANGEFPPQAADDSGIDEINLLMKSLNHMRDRLSNMIAKLKRSHARELQARRDAENANHLKSDFLEGISSELRNPLDAISRISTRLLREIRNVKNASPPPIEELAVSLEGIRANNDKLKEVIETILDLAKLNASDFTPDGVEFDPGAMMHDLYRSAQKLAAGKSLELENHYTPDMPRVIYTDREFLFHILTLILSSLVKHAPASGKIVFGCSGPGKTIVFWFKATGGNQLADQFLRFLQTQDADPFRKGGRTDTHSILNLTIARSNAHLLGAEFEASSFETSEFHFKVSFLKADITPLSLSDTTRLRRRDIINNNPGGGDMENAIPGQKSMETTKTNLLHSIRNVARDSFLSHPEILILENSASTASVLKMMLRDFPCSIDLVATERECLEACENKRYKIVLMSAVIPGISASSLTRRLRELAHGAPSGIIILMGYQEEGGKEAFLAAGADICLAKPVNADELLQAIRSLSV